MEFKEATDLWKPTGISFGSGGTHVFALLGTLSRLLESGTIDNVMRWYGCSAGSFCAYLGALGVTSTWIQEMLVYFDMRIVENIEEDRLTDFLNCWGINSGKGMSEFLGRFLDTWEPGASTWTFADLASKRPGVSLNITATNLTLGSLAVFSAKTTPALRILDAIRASSSVPLIFTPWMDAHGSMYCDGGVLEEYPWSYVENKEKTLVVVCSDTAICRRTPTKAVIRTLGEYMGRIFKLCQQNQCTDIPKYWIAINNRTVDTLDFKIEPEERTILFQDGVRAASGWLRFRTKQVPMQETRGSHPPSGGRYTSSSFPHAPNKTSESHQSRTPLPHPYPSRGLHSGGTRCDRRWSL
jgi:NTE family protein